MRLALQLAERARGHTHPNPVVGAVVVEGGRIVARGYHQRAGGPHAEIVALDALGRPGPARDPVRHAGALLPHRPHRPLHRTGAGRRDPAGGDRLPGREPAGVGQGRPPPAPGGRAGRRRLPGGGVPGREPRLLPLDPRGPPAGHAEGRRHAGRLHRPPPPQRHRQRPIHWITGPAARAGRPPAARAPRRHPGGRGHGARRRPAADRAAAAGRAPAGAPPLRVVLDGHLRTPPGARLLRRRTGARAAAAGHRRPTGSTYRPPNGGRALGASGRCGGPGPRCWLLPAGARRAHPPAPRAGGAGHRGRCSRCWSRAAARSTARSSPRGWWTRWRCSWRPGCRATASPSRPARRCPGRRPLQPGPAKGRVAVG